MYYIPKKSEHTCTQTDIVRDNTLLHDVPINLISSTLMNRSVLKLLKENTTTFPVMEINTFLSSPLLQDQKGKTPMQGTQLRQFYCRGHSPQFYSLLRRPTERFSNFCYSHFHTLHLVILILGNSDLEHACSVPGRKHSCYSKSCKAALVWQSRPDFQLKAQPGFYYHL